MASSVRRLPAQSVAREQPQERDYPRLARAVAWLVPVALGAVTIRASVRSLNWPLLQDVPLMHYIAVGMLHGAVPYRDVLDMNMPGTYWIHEAVVAAFGTGDLAWRLFDLGYLAAICLTAASILRDSGGAACALGVVLLAAWHLDAGPMCSGQRDFLAVLPLMIAAYASIEFANGGRRRELATAGVAIGLATLIKPTGLLVPVFLMPALFVLGRCDLRTVALDTVWLTVPTLAVVSAAAAVLAAEGALGAFIAGWHDFIVPVYSKLHDLSPTLWQSAGRIALRLLPAMLLIGASWAFVSGSTNRPVHFLVAGFAAWGVFNFLQQDKGWFYHSYPWAMFTIVWSAAAAGDLLRAGRRHALYAAALLIFICPAMVFHDGRLVGEPGSDKEQVVPLARFIAHDLSRLIGPRDEVQTIDTTDGAIHALLLLNVRQPTPFIYDWMLLAGGDTPFRRAARAKFLDLMKAHPPKAIVITNQQWPEPSHGYRRVGSWGEFSDFLVRSYTLRGEMHEVPKTSHSRGYLIYIRNAGLG